MAQHLAHEVTAFELRFPATRVRETALLLARLVAWARSLQGAGRFPTSQRELLDIGIDRGRPMDPRERKDIARYIL